MANEEKTSEALEPVSDAESDADQRQGLADELEQAIGEEPVNEELIEELRAAEADFRAAEKSHIEARRQAEKAAEQLQAIIATVLDAAEVANKAASSASLSHKSLSDATTKLTRGSQAGTKMSSIFLGVAGFVFLGSAGALIAMTIQLNQRVNQADALLVKIGTQAIGLKDSLGTVDSVGESIKVLSSKNQGLMTAQTEISAKVVELGTALKAMQEEAAKRDADIKKTAAESSKALLEAAKAPAKPDPQLAKLLQDVNALSGQVKSLNGQVANQTKALGETGGKIAAVNKEVQDLKRVGANVDTLKKEVEALIVLERQRYREALEAATRRNTQEKSVAFPRAERPTGTATP
jgi:DNA repair exonuclease SbcCD ATPase subunit